MWTSTPLETSVDHHHDVMERGLSRRRSSVLGANAPNTELADEDTVLSVIHEGADCRGQITVSYKPDDADGQRPTLADLAETVAAAAKGDLEKVNGAVSKIKELKAAENALIMSFFDASLGMCGCEFDPNTRRPPTQLVSA